MPTATEPRKFGVEVEVGYLDPELPAEPTKERTCGCEGACKQTVPVNNDAHAEALRKRIKSCFEAGMFSKDWSELVHTGGMGGQAYDGTTIEFRFGPVAGDAGYEEFTKFLDYIRDNGGYVTKGDGMHVHLDGTGFYEDNKGNEKADVLFETWTNNREHVLSLLPQRRKVRRWGCTAWTPSAVQQYKTSKSGGGREIHLATGHKTIEVRIFQGTLNTTLATAWITFCHALLDYSLANAEALPTQEAPKAFLDALHVPANAVATLLDYEDDVTGPVNCGSV